MAPKALFASSEDSSHHDQSSLFSASSSSHSIAKPKPLRKGPIIRVVHVFAPKLITTDVANFRTLVQQLTGNHPSSPNEAEEAEEEEEEEAKDERSHDHGNPGNFCNQAAAINPAKQLIESRLQNAREATTIPAMLHTQFEEDYEDPFLHYGTFQAGLASNHSGIATRFNEINGYFGGNQAGLATIEERGGHVPAANQDGLASGEEGINYFSANYDYDDAYSHGSPSSLDSSSTRGDDSHSNERGNNACVFSDELDLMGGFNSSYPFINLDDQHFPQLFMSALDTKLECSLLNPTW